MDSMPRNPKNCYEFTHRKYSLNIPTKMFEMAEARAIEAGFVELAPYLRAIISREIKDNTFTIQDIIQKRTIRKMEWNEVCRRAQQDNPRKSKSFLDKVQKLAYTFQREIKQQFFEF